MPGFHAVSLKRESCERCRVFVDYEEWVNGWGLCDSCFEEHCPCQEGRPGSCPLHPWPDVVLSLEVVS